MNTRHVTLTATYVRIGTGPALIEIGDEGTARVHFAEADPGASSLAFHRLGGTGPNHISTAASVGIWALSTHIKEVSLVISGEV